MANFLVVEDDDFFRKALVTFLRSKNHEVFEAPNGKLAKDVLGAQKIDVVVSDMQMPFLNGIELFEWIKSQKLTTKFLLMTGFSHLIETQQAYSLGVDEFLTKPFRNEELFEAVQKILGVNKTAPEGSAVVREKVYCKVSIDEFVTRPKIDFDVFVKLTETKYVRIGRAGELIPTDRIEQYKSKGVRHLHIKSEDFHKLVEFNLQFSKVLQNRKDVPKEKKANFIRYTGEMVMEKAFIAGVDQETFKEAQDFLGLSVNMISDETEYFDLLGLLNSHTDYIYAHSLGVAMYALMIARKKGFESQQVFFKLSMAGIFHDIGKKEIDREIIEKARPLLTQAERRIIESHPVRGKEILLTLKSIPTDVVQLVYEHHEDVQGQGFPRGINRRQMHPLSPILQVANLFVEYALKGPHNEARPAKAAIQYIESVYMDRVDEKALAALKSLFA